VLKFPKRTLLNGRYRILELNLLIHSNFCACFYKISCAFL